MLNDDVMRQASLDADELQALSEREWSEVERRAKEYRAVRPRESLVDRTALIVDDGVATGATARAACQIASEHGARRVVLAVPVAPLGWTRAFHDVADECIALETPSGFIAVGAHYQDFRATPDDEVLRCLAAASSDLGQDADRRGSRRGGFAGRRRSRSLLDARGLIVFAHGSGSSHRSVRNRFVADRLADAGLATALVDLLTADEDGDRDLVFDIDFLTGRLLALTGWLQRAGWAPVPAAGVLRSQYRCGRCARSSRRSWVTVWSLSSRGGPPRPRSPGASRGHGAHPAHRRGCRHDRPGAQPSSPGAAGLSCRAARGSGGHAPVRRARRARGRSPTRPPTGSSATVCDVEWSTDY